MAELAFEESLFNQAYFHCHQAAERTLKAVLAHRSKTPPRTHRLVDLVTSLEEVEPNLKPAELASELRRLENYYVPVRYPDALTGSLSEGLPDEQEATDALTTAKKVSEAVRGVIERG